MLLDSQIRNFYQNSLADLVQILTYDVNNIENI